MTKEQMTVIRWEMALWASVILAAVMAPPHAWVALGCAVVVRVQIWRIERRDRPRGPGFWARVWDR